MSEASRKFTVSLRQPLGDTVVMTDSQRHVPRLLTRGARGQLGGNERKCLRRVKRAQAITGDVCNPRGRGGLQRNIWSESGWLCSMSMYAHGWTHTVVNSFFSST